MVYESEVFIGRNNKKYILRSPKLSDTGNMITYLKTTAQETEYGLSYPEEMDFSIKDEEDFIRSFLEDKKSLMISVFEGERLVGNASLTCVLDKKKTAHRATFGIAMVKSVWGQGLGHKVLAELLTFAKTAGYEQIELEVACDNTAAVSLYKKLGFRVYGERPRSLRLKDGGYYDELLMIREIV